MPYMLFCPTKLIVSADAGADLAREVEELPPGRALVVTDSGLLQAGIVKPWLESLAQAGREPAVFSDVPTNPAVEDVRAAVAAARRVDPVVIVAVGGGSPMDVAKAVGLLLGHVSDDWESFQWARVPVTRSSRPVIAVPTTAGTGSEVTHVAVIGDSAGFKKGLVHPNLFPRAAIVDGRLMLGLPPALTAATGLDALTHGIEAYLGQRHNPSMDLFALAALRAIVRWLPRAVARGDDVDARCEMAQAASWAGMAMDQAGLGLCHALCGPLTTAYHLHHGLGNALLLPAVLAFNAPAISPARWPALREALDLPASAHPADAAEWVRGFVFALGLPTTLRQVPVDAARLEAMAQEAMRMAMIHNNVRPATANDCRAVLEAAL